jgi:hypothetical protein
VSQHVDRHDGPRRLLLHLRQNLHGLLIRRLILQHLPQQLDALVAVPRAKRAHGLFDGFFRVHSGSNRRDSGRHVQAPIATVRGFVAD